MERKISNSFYETNITLILKPSRQYKDRKLQTNITHVYTCKSTEWNTSKQNTTQFKKIMHNDLSRSSLRMQGCSVLGNPLMSYTTWTNLRGKLWLVSQMLRKTDKIQHPFMKQSSKTGIEVYFLTL